MTENAKLFTAQINLINANYLIDGFVKDSGDEIAAILQAFHEGKEISDDTIAQACINALDYLHHARELIEWSAKANSTDVRDFQKTNDEEFQKVKDANENSEFIQELNRLARQTSEERMAEFITKQFEKIVEAEAEAKD